MHVRRRMARGETAPALACEIDIDRGMMRTLSLGVRPAPRTPAAPGNVAA